MTGFLRHIDCLDKGYVGMVTWLPWSMADLYEAIDSEDWYKAMNLLDMEDLTGVNAAYASFARSAKSIGDRGRRLIKYLANHHEDEPFRHTAITLEIKAPLMVARQWFKYRVGSRHSPDSAEWLGISFGQGDDGGFGDLDMARSESSRRYVTSEPEFYTPSVWRSAPENKKQGSGGPVDDVAAKAMTRKLIARQAQGKADYEDALEDDICAEQARLFLPAYGLYLYWRWTASLGAVCHFLNQRLGDDAQDEITEYAQAVYALVSQPAVYPLSVAALVKGAE